MNVLVDIGKGLGLLLGCFLIGVWGGWLCLGGNETEGTRWVWLWVASWVVTVLFFAWGIGSAL